MKPGPLFVLVVSSLLVGCSWTEPPSEQGGGALVGESHPDAMRARGWLEFADVSLRVKSEGGAPRGPHVRGWVLGGTFIPEGDVVDRGAPPLASARGQSGGRSPRR